MAEAHGVVRGTTSVVPVVSRRSSSFAVLLAVVLGLPAGLLVYASAALLFADPTRRTPDTSFVLLSFVGGWALATALMVRGTSSVVRVFRRALLLGAAQWLLLAPLVGRFGGHELARAGDELRVSLHGLPLALPAAGQALLLAAACLLSAMLVGALLGALGMQPRPVVR
jgi:hypothetical protein